MSDKSDDYMIVGCEMRFVFGHWFRDLPCVIDDEQRFRIAFRNRLTQSCTLVLTSEDMYVYFNFRMQDAILVLEDGTVFEGKGFFIDGEVFGEVVFNTSMTGYEEVFTDPSYAGQILVMTYPLIGNYGFHRKYCESGKTQIRGLILKEPYFFAERGKRFGRYLEEAGLPCLYDIDTRALTLKIRDHGAMTGMLVNKTKYQEIEQLIKKIQQLPHPDTRNLVAGVSCREVAIHKSRARKRVVLIDCGVRKSIIKNLVGYATVIQVPYDTEAEAISELKPDGVVLSNGPGNPEHPEILASTVATLKKIVHKYPVFGIGLGNQLLGIALGFKTYKMKFGHRGSNHAVKNLLSNRVYITSQSHGYAIQENNVHDVEISWINVNDHTIEGLRHKKLPVYSAQFIPEDGLGPNDTTFLLKEFFNA